MKCLNVKRWPNVLIWDQAPRQVGTWGSFEGGRLTWYECRSSSILTCVMDLSTCSWRTIVSIQ
jgi:hypothetical protein